MINKFIEIYDSNKNELEEQFKLKHPEDYSDIVKKVVTLISKYDDCYGKMDIDRIHIINDGDYQGTLLFIVGCDNYQPDNYWSIKVYYGSCSGCDTYQSIRYCYPDDIPTEEQVKDYMTLALHIVQAIKKV